MDMWPTVRRLRIEPSSRSFCGRRTMTMTPTKAIRARNTPALERAMASAGHDRDKENGRSRRPQHGARRQSASLKRFTNGRRIPGCSKNQRHIEVSSEMIPIGEQSNRFFRIRHIVETKRTARSLRHLQEPEKQGEAAQEKKQPCESKPVAQIKLQHREKYRRRNNKRSGCRPCGLGSYRN